MLRRVGCPAPIRIAPLLCGGPACYDRLPLRRTAALASGRQRARDRSPPANPLNADYARRCRDGFALRPESGPANCRDGGLAARACPVWRVGSAIPFAAVRQCAKVI